MVTALQQSGLLFKCMYTKLYHVSPITMLFGLTAIWHK